MTHRFYVGELRDKSGSLELTGEFWVNDFLLTNQVLKVLRMRVGDELILFDGQGTQRLYKIMEIEPKAFRLSRVTDIAIKKPAKKILLSWSLLKKDKNEWVVQKATELGVEGLLPIISERTEKTGFDTGRMHKIAIEAAEQCGRHTIPVIREPQLLHEVVGEYSAHIPLYVAEMEASRGPLAEDSLLLLIGPEGGWSDSEKSYFAEHNIKHIGLGDFTLRAETAAIAAVHAASL